MGKKRKHSAADASFNKPSKHRVSTGEQSLPEWHDYPGFTTAQMRDGQSLLFVGAAVLQILQGSIDVCGRVLTAESPLLKLNTAGRNGLAIVLTAHAVQTQVPFAPNEVVEFTLQSPSDDQDQQALTKSHSWDEEGQGEGFEQGEGQPHTHSNQQQQQRRRRRHSNQQQQEHKAGDPSSVSAEQLQGPPLPAHRSSSTDHRASTFALLQPPQAAMAMQMQGREGGGTASDRVGSGSGFLGGSNGRTAHTQPNTLPPLQHTPLHSSSSTTNSPPAMHLPLDWAAAIACVCDSAAAAAAAAQTGGTLGTAGSVHLGERRQPAYACVGADGGLQASTSVAVAVVGSKGVGKSSLSRFLVNHLLNQHAVVAYLDTDCGQPELTPPGMVSLSLLTAPLAGPPCTHMRHPHRAHYIGSTSPELNPDHYVAAVTSLLAWYRSPDCAIAAANTAAAAVSCPSMPTYIWNEHLHSQHSSDPAHIENGSGLSGEEDREEERGGVNGRGSEQARRKAGSDGMGEGVRTRDEERGCGAVGLEGMWGDRRNTEEASAGPCLPPLVVNMQGWVKGLGYELTVDILRALGPTHLLQVQSPVAKRNLPAQPFWFEGPPEQCPTHAMLLASPSSSHNSSGPNTQQPTAAGNGHVHSNAGAGLLGGVQGVRGGAAAEQDEDEDLDENGGPEMKDEEGREAWGNGSGSSKGERVGGKGGVAWASKAGSLKPVDTRALQWHAWAKAAVGWDGTWGAYEGPDLYASASALAAARPYVVSLRDLHIHFLHVGAVPLPHLGYALNGVMVGLAVCGSGVRHSIDSGPLITGTLSAAAGSLQGSVTCTDEQGNGRSSGEAPAAPVWPGMGVCVGVGLVRAVDMKRQELYVLTPTPEEQLEQVKTLLVGQAAGDLPTSLLQAADLPAVSPYLSLFGLSGFSGAAAGAAGMKGGRKNLGRASLADGGAA